MLGIPFFRSYALNEPGVYDNLNLMLTRLKISGFKNLIGVDVSFGPFTCIAGANGVGKSNLLDAIVFLSALADRPLIDAALAVRDQGAKTGDIRGLFHHVGDHYSTEMTFEVEMIIPKYGTDDLGQPALASSTFVQYSISLRYKDDTSGLASGSLELIREELKPMLSSEADRHLRFEHSNAWRSTNVQNQRPPTKYISTEGDGPDRVVNIHPDGRGSGMPEKPVTAAKLPRTVLSASHSSDSPTALLAKREMQAWQLLRLEPSSLREPDSVTWPADLGADGSHLPAALYRLAHAPGRGDSAAIYSEVANRVGRLINDVRSVSVELDEGRQLLTAYVTGRDGTAYPARSLSDGTLRFLALAVLALDPDPQGLICMEEPENGIHPERIRAMIQLLDDLATDVNAAEFDDQATPIRQVIINTHSPAVVMQVPDESLLIAESVNLVQDERSFRGLQLRCLAGTWRDKAGLAEAASKGKLLGYLNPVSLPEESNPQELNGSGDMNAERPARRVIDREDLRQYKIPFSEIA